MILSVRLSLYLSAVPNRAVSFPFRAQIGAFVPMLHSFYNVQPVDILHPLSLSAPVWAKPKRKIGCFSLKRRLMESH